MLGDGDGFRDWMYRTIAIMFWGAEDRVMTVVTPAEVANRAATIFVLIPPVPSFEPICDTMSTSASSTKVAGIVSSARRN